MIWTQGQENRPLVPLGFAFADSIARNLGLAPSGKGFWKAAAYWALTEAIAIGGAVIGWYAGSAIIKYVTEYLTDNVSYIIKVAAQRRSSFSLIMRFLGLNPFDYIHDAGKLNALARELNGFKLPQQWAYSFCHSAYSFGLKLIFDEPHGGYGYHIHLCGQRGQKLDGLHLVVGRYIWEALKAIWG